MNSTSIDERVNPALKRLTAINWKLDYHDERSYVELMYEYLRRMALWTSALQLEDGGPFFDVAALLCPDTPLPPPLKEAVDAAVHARNPLVRAICEWHLHWVLIAQLPAVTRFGLPAPYEPLIRFYERNGSFRREDVFVNVGIVGISISRWRNYGQRQPLLDLDDATLDQLDATPWPNRA